MKWRLLTHAWSISATRSNWIDPIADDQHPHNFTSVELCAREALCALIHTHAYELGSTKESCTSTQLQNPMV